MTHRLLRALLACTTAVALVTGCGSRPDPTPGRTSSVAARADGVDQISNDDPRLPIHMQWPTVAGADELSTAIRAWAEQREASFRADYQPADEAPPELGVTWELLPIERPLVGVRLHVWEFAGASGEASSRTFYADTVAHQAYAGADLIRPERRPDVAAAVVDALGRQSTPSLLSAAEAASVPDLLAAVAFRHGRILVHVGQGVLRPYSDGELDVELPAALDPALTPIGERIRAQSAAAAPAPAPTPPPTVPTQGPTSVPTPTAQRPDCARLACVALTFDDGPGPVTDQILDTLVDRGARATFFELGEAAAVYPDVVRRQASLGMVLGTHTVDHKQLTTMAEAQQRAEIDGGADQIAAAGVPRPRWLRPPYGSYNAATRQLGWPIVLWNVDSEDWKNRDAQQTTVNVLAQVQPGSIVLLHDIHPSTARALPGIIDGLRARGYTLVTLPELVGEPQSGVVYFGRDSTR